MKNGFRVIDAEPHLEEPFDLWERNLEERYRRELKIIPAPMGHLEVGGATIELHGVPIRRRSGSSSDRSFVQIQGERRWKSAPDLVKARTPHSRPEVYVEGFDIEGVDVGLLMPTFTGHILEYPNVELNLDPGLALAICQIHNDWAHEFARSHPARFGFWGIIPTEDARLGAQEARRCMTELGAVGVTGKGSGRYLCNDHGLAPLWETLDELAAPVGFHGFSRGGAIRRGDPGHERLDWILGPFPADGPHEVPLRSLIFGGVLDRYPHITPVFMESGVSAVPYMLEKLNDQWSLFGPDADFNLQMWPSEYYKSRCYAVTYAEELLHYAIDYLGDDHLLFSTDYPHHDSPFPNAVTGFLALEHVSEASKRKILWDNAVCLFKLAEGEPAGGAVR